MALALETAQNRLDLLGAEFEQEKLRIFDALAVAALALVCISLGLLLCAALLIMLAPETWRPLVIAGLALACLAGGALLFTTAKRQLRNPGGALGASRAELATDRAALDAAPPP